MKIIQVTEEEFMKMIIEVHRELELFKSEHENKHYNSDAEYKTALHEMYEKFMSAIRYFERHIEGG